jgi:hypothetical protein
MLVLRWVTEVVSVVEQEENNTEKNPAVINKSIDKDFAFVGAFRPNRLARGANHPLLAGRVICPLLEIAV